MSISVIGEHQALMNALNSQRAHIFKALDGVDDEALHRGMLPSGWSCLGLVNHLALDVERFWFQAVVAGNGVVIDQMRNSSYSAWEVGTDVSTESVLDVYRRNIDRADRIIATASLDGSPSWWPTQMFGTWRVDTVREIVLHVVCETATHAGHLDAARELIDGTQHLVLTE